MPGRADALDSVASDAVLGLLLQVNAEGVAVVLVTHDPRVSARAQRLLVLADGQLCAHVDLGPFVPDELDARTRAVTDALDQHR